MHPCCLMVPWMHHFEWPCHQDNRYRNCQCDPHNFESSNLWCSFCTHCWQCKTCVSRTRSFRNGCRGRHLVQYMISFRRNGNTPCYKHQWQSMNHRESRCWKNLVTCTCYKHRCQSMNHRKSRRRRFSHMYIPFFPDVQKATTGHEERGIKSLSRPIYSQYCTYRRHEQSW